MADVGGVRIWSDLREHYWEATLILLCGGLIGVFFIIFLRRSLTIDADLPWPESIACVSIVKSGDAAETKAPRYVFGALGFAALIHLFKSEKGLHIFREFTEGFIAFPRAVVRHFDYQKAPIGSVTHGGGIPWATPALSPALIGIGYIIGPRYAFINVSGGVLAWWVLIPLLLFFDPDLPQRFSTSAPVEIQAYTLWYNVVRPVAVGMMLVGAAWTLLSMRSSFVQSIKGAFAASRTTRHAGAPLNRLDRDLPTRWILVATLGLLVPITAIYYWFTVSWLAAILAAAAMTATGFLLSAVGGYLVGLVGASNQPLSGLTLSALVISALFLLVFGVKGAAGVAAVLGVAAVVSVACSVSGSLIQDFKAGQLLGGTPWKMQLVEIIAVAMLAFFLMGPIIALHQANLDTGGIGGRALPAPQAGLMAQLAKGIVGGEMAWGLLVMGAAFGVAMVACGARSVMLIAVGMYLPFDTSSAIALGGVMKWVADKYTGPRAEAERVRIEERGTLLASGLIAGDAIAGILLAVTFLAGVPSLTRVVSGADALPFFPALGGWLSLLAFAAIAWVLIRVPVRPTD
jgi:putative OPT family oligopeptide transporter